MSASDDCAEARLSRAATDAGRLQRACLTLVAEHERNGELPTSIRFLFYELEQRGLIAKHRVNRDGSPSVRRSDQDVSDALGHLREVGLVPWDWLTDETRELHEWAYGATIADAVRAEVDRARLDAWAGEPPR